MTQATSPIPCCPHCGGTGATGNVFPQAVRTLDRKGRVVVPAAFADGLRFSAVLRAGVLVLKPSARGSHVLIPVNAGGTCYRLTIPAEFRAALGLRPGSEVALAREGSTLLVWRA